MNNSYLSKNGSSQQDPASKSATRPLAQDQQQQQHHPSETSSMPAPAVGFTPIVSTHTLVIGDGEGSTINVPLVRADELPTYIQVAIPHTSTQEIVGQDHRFNKIMAYADVSNFMGNQGRVSFNPSLHSIWSDMDDHRPSQLGLSNTTQYGSMPPFSPLSTNGGGSGGLGSSFQGGFDVQNVGLQGITPNGLLDLNDLSAINQALADLAVASSAGNRSHPDTQDFAARQQYLQEQGLFRKEPCNAWRQKGHCKWGDKCTYSHDHQPTSAFTYPIIGASLIPNGTGVGLSANQQTLQQQQMAILQLQQAILQQQQQSQALLQNQVQAQQQQQQQQHNSHSPNSHSPPQSHQSSPPQPTSHLIPSVAPYKPHRLGTIQTPTSAAPYRPPALVRASSSPSATAAPSGTKPKGLKTHCSYFFRTGQCDFMQQGCKYSHERPEDPIIRDNTVVVPGKNTTLPNGIASDGPVLTAPQVTAANPGLATKPRQLPIFANLSRTSPTPEYSNLGGLHGSITHTIRAKANTLSSPLKSSPPGLFSLPSHNSATRTRSSPLEGTRGSKLLSRQYLDGLASDSRPGESQAQQPIGSGRYETASRIWGSGVLRSKFDVLDPKGRDAIEESESGGSMEMTSQTGSREELSEDGSVGRRVESEKGSIELISF